jgi:two-component system sensor histidine kinase CpxA
MKSLFLKIFLWFWAAQIVVAASLFALAVATRDTDARMRRSAGESLQAWARASAVALEFGGPRALRQAWVTPARGGPDDRRSASLHSVRPPGRPDLPLAGPAPPREAAFLIGAAAQNGEAVMRETDGGSWLAHRIVTAGGGEYVAVIKLRSPPGGLGPLFDRGQLRPEGLLRLLVIGLSLGAVCFALARYLAAPAQKLKAATQQFASGDFSVRVAPQMGRRRDELADLGRDFDLMAERIQGLVLSERRLLGDISHELRSPLARLQVALDLAWQTADEPTRAYLARIEREGHRLNHLIGQVLTLARLESAGAQAAREPLDLSRLVEEVAADADFEARARSVRVVFQFDGERAADDERRSSHENSLCTLPAGSQATVVSGNRELLGSAIENVVRNAVRYAPEQSQVEISLGVGAGPVAVLRVRDRGPGVPESEVEHLFRPFYRLAEARDRQSGGVGLGLSITARAVAFHGGGVAVANAPGGGLAVEIRLPLSAPTSN